MKEPLPFLFCLGPLPTYICKFTCVWDSFTYYNYKYKCVTHTSGPKIFVACKLYVSICATGATIFSVRCERRRDDG